MKMLSLRRWLALRLTVPTLLFGGIVGVSVVAGSPPASAATSVEYVAVGGSDTGNCQSAGSPCATIAYAYLQTSAASSSTTIDMGPGEFQLSSLCVCGGQSGYPYANIVTIQGSASGAAPATTLDGQATAARGELTLDDVTVNGQSGDALTGDYGGTIQLVASTVTNSNSALYVIGIDSNISITDSTISGNGEAVDFTVGPGTFTSLASTITGNGAGLIGAGSPFYINIADTIVSNNNNHDFELSGQIGVDDYGYNIDDDDTWGFTAATSLSDTPAGLDPSGLKNNGGPTRTVVPTTGSPVIGAVPTGTTLDGVQVCPRTDQRGVASVGNCTIGAVEVTEPQPPPPPTHGYWLVGSDGGIFSFGSAQFYGSTGSLHLQSSVVGIVPTADRGGYWLDASDGGVFSYGNTQFYGSIPGLGLHPAGSGLPNSLNAPIVGMVPSHDLGGYFMVASDGGVFAFGDAHFAGSCPGIGGCSGKAVAVMPDASGNGYWLITSTGGVYTFGDAPYLGGPGAQSTPITSAVATPSGHGYWILDAAGQVYAYGDAAFMGNVAAGQTGGVNPASAIFATSDGGGYWVSDTSGKVFVFGDAPNDGDMSGVHLNGPVIAASGS